MTKFIFKNIFRVTSSLLTTFECTELIAQTSQEYIDIAVRLGTDSDYLEKFRSKIWSTRDSNPLFDSVIQARELEKLYKKMWMRHEKDLKPDHILA